MPVTVNTSTSVTGRVACPHPLTYNGGTSCNLVDNGDNVVVAITYIQSGHRLVDNNNSNDIEDNMMLATTTIQGTTTNIASTMATMWCGLPLTYNGSTRCKRVDRHNHNHNNDNMRTTWCW